MNKTFSYRNLSHYFSLLAIAVSLPFILWAVGGILPTFDDFTTLQSPQFTPWLSAEGLLPNDSFWRPWDYLFGCLLGRFPELFPWLNHTCVILGHTINTCLVFMLCNKLRLGSFAANVAALFFFFSPATLGATLACDGLNQTYAQMWGLVALAAYLYKRYWLWPLLVLVAALAKENGLAWAVVPPIVAYAFKLIDRKQTLKHCGVGMVIAVVYFTARLCLAVTDNINNEYTDAAMASHLKDLVQLLAYNWLPIDYVSVVYTPTRNMVLALITLVLSIPFLWQLFVVNNKLAATRTAILITACFFILAAPHLLTLVSIMHNYAPLSMAALLVAFVIRNNHKPRSAAIAFTLFLTAALATDIHHVVMARSSGQLGRQLATEAIEKTREPVKKAFCISIDERGTPCYSSFCVRPVDAFAWGLSVRHYTGYKWPETVSDTILSIRDEQQLKALADSALLVGNDVVWIVDKGVTVINGE